MKTYVLVHGAWMGPAAWKKVTPLLEAGGNRVITVELPAHGEDRTPASEATLESYRETVVNAIPDSGAIVVGHSLAGVVITAAGEAAPEKVQALVYVAAYLPRNGESLYQLAQTDAGSKVGQYWHQDDPAHYSPATIRKEGIVEVFAQDCSPEDQEFVVSTHREEPLGPMAAPVATTPERFGSLPKTYVATRLDHCVSYPLQQRMLAAQPGVRVVELESGHCPFLSKPTELAAILLEV